ncbi:MAG TPA: PRC-barrel domain-containing protein [Chloroflexota bacterium]|nr:PRC-barrel domain-containing protein [Chloroflexota bacterium]
MLGFLPLVDALQAARHHTERESKRKEMRMMQGEAFRGLAVVSVQQAQNLGTVEDLLLDLTKHRVAALLLQGGLFRGGPMVRWSDIRSIGRDAVMVDDSSAAIPTAEQDQVMRLASLRDTQVVGDNGELAGTVAGVEIDPDTGKVTAYVVTAPEGGGLFHSAPRFRVQPEAIAGIGPKLITINAQAIDFQHTE